MEEYILPIFLFFWGNDFVSQDSSELQFVPGEELCWKDEDRGLLFLSLTAEWKRWEICPANISQFSYIRESNKHVFYLLNLMSSMQALPSGWLWQAIRNLFLILYFPIPQLLDKWLYLTAFNPCKSDHWWWRLWKNSMYTVLLLCIPSLAF